MDLSLKDKRAIVCGSTQGIGKAVAMELARLECSITLIARNQTALQQTIEELSNNGKQAHDFIAVDFSFPEQLKEKIEKYAKGKGTIHILINNTGGPKGGPIISAETDDFIKTFNAHLICNHILMQACLEGMKNANYGRIINIISTSVKQPLKNLGVSNTVRAAVANWSKTLAGEAAGFGITVNNVLPGATNTQRLKQIINDKAAKTGKSAGEVEKEMMGEIPALRFAEPGEIANAVAFLASPAAAYINGINLPVDGGRTKCL
ncbi:MAG TPA: SDR family oxidoreductase [Bacteroidia bacterium]|nr:SDR family oxidoreductase [Bacteroidia bacterium]